jgi:hypothetical protein
LKECIELDFVPRASRVDDDWRSEMNLRVGDTVLVNAAAFIAARSRMRDAVSCDVPEVDAEGLLVRTQRPYRVFTMWVSKGWIEDADCLADSVSVLRECDSVVT